jgi:DNA-binding NarL/FixJ family response regulator
MITVLLVDDHELVRAGFRVILQSEPGITVVGEASNGGDAVRLAERLHPGVICMDVQMPDMDGLEATRRIVALDGVTSSVLILTTFDRDDYLFSALRAGASGFLLKTASPEHLIEAVQVLARGEALLSPRVTRRVIQQLATAPEPSPVREDADALHSRLGSLTEREADVFSLVARGLSNGEIASALFVGEATVKSHVSSLLAKLGVRDRIQAVIFAHEHGVVSREG